MPNLTKEQVIEKLKTFKHAVRTNPAKRTLTNHDALAFVFWSLGPMEFWEVQDIMSEWRCGTSERKEVVTNEWEVKKYGRKPQVRHYAPMAFTYLFNTSVYGGYGYVGETHMTPGNWLHYASSVSTCRRHPNPKEIAKVNSTKDPDDRHPYGWARERYVFRRTYWFRQARGLYAPTLECAKRMSEIGHIFA